MKLPNFSDMKKIPTNNPPTSSLKLLSIEFTMNFELIPNFVAFPGIVEIGGGNCVSPNLVHCVASRNLDYFWIWIELIHSKIHLNSRSTRELSWWSSFHRNVCWLHSASLGIFLLKCDTSWQKCNWIKEKCWHIVNEERKTARKKVEWR